MCNNNCRLVKKLRRHCATWKAIAEANAGSYKAASEMCEVWLTELNRTKRALWLARAKRAHERANMLRYMWHVLVSVKKSNDKKLVKIVRRDYDVWCVVARKCRTYADKFKE